MFLTVALLFGYVRYRSDHKPVFAIAEEEKNIYLTFDDGPSDSTTPYILETLQEEDVKATFFIIGKQAALRPGLIERIYENGHSIGILPLPLLVNLPPFSLPFFIM